MQKVIIWHKWQDPFMPLVDGKVLKGFEPEEDEEDKQFHKARQSFQKDDDCESCGINEGPTKSVGPCVYGPNGIVPLHESNLPSKLYNFWMGHTNFDITAEVCDQISVTPGVETLDIFTRYRFRLGIGRAFNQDAVMKDIEQRVCPVCQPKVPKKVESTDPLGALKAALTKQYPFWAIVVTPNKIRHYFGGQTKDEVLVKTKDHQGEILLSWETS